MTLCIECQQSDIQKALSKACEVSTVNTKKTKVMSRQAHATPYTELTITVGDQKLDGVEKFVYIKRTQVFYRIARDS